MLFNVCALYIKIMNNENQTIHKSNDNLTIYGWNEKLNQLKQESIYSTLAHGRVSIVHRTCYEVISGNGLFQCELTGNMMYGKSDDELPCTGDWVIFQPFDEHKGIIVDSLPRERTLYRKKSGTVADKQAIASYVDKAFIVQSLDDNFNVRRAERFIAQIMEENIKPVLVLNKADLGCDRQNIDEAIKHIARQFPVFITSICLQSDTRIFYEHSSTPNDSPVAGIHNKRRNGRVCRLFGCRQEFTGEYPLREIGTEYFRYKPVYREGTAYFDSSGNGIGGWLRCFNRHSGRP